MTKLPLSIQSLDKHYRLANGKSVFAVNGVSLNLEEGKTLAVVGESGCGKSTLAKVIMGIEKPTAGTVEFYGKEASVLSQSERTEQVQMVFQDPYGSMNPRKRIWQIITEPQAIAKGSSKSELKARALELMADVGLRPEWSDRFPHMLSGGQRQRVAIARALCLHPKTLILDEPVSALDVSVQAQVLNLLVELQDRYRLSYLFISHDLAVVRHLSHWVCVMYLGEIIESGSAQEIFESPKHPYTQALLRSAQTHAPSSLSGDLPSPFEKRIGCNLAPRCAHALDRCHSRKPQPQALGSHVYHCDVI